MRLHQPEPLLEGCLLSRVASALGRSKHEVGRAFNHCTHAQDSAFRCGRKHTVCSGQCLAAVVFDWRRRKECKKCKLTVRVLLDCDHPVHIADSSSSLETRQTRPCSECSLRRRHKWSFIF